MTQSSRCLVLILALTLGACARPCPSFAPAPPAVSDAPADAQLGLGEASVDVVVRGADDGRPRIGVPVTLACACLRAPLRLATGPDGLARARGLPAGSYEIDVERPPYARQGARVVLAASTRLRVVREQPAEPRRERAAPSLVPPGVALRYEETACLGSCPAFVAWLDDQGRVRLERDGHTSEWRLGPVARRRALRLARCVARAPTYERVMLDAPTTSVAVRDGDGVAVSRHDHGDPRAPRALADLEAKLARVLGVARRLDRSR